jgi:putative transposase
MRRPRLLAPADLSHPIYHCVSRVVNRGRVLGDAEKEKFREYMRLYERLLGVQVLTHCLMDNHFHILVQVPRRPEVLPTNDELVGLVRATLGEARADNLANWFAHLEGQNNHPAIEAERERWFRQMWNLASFMKVLKQRFSQWFNGTREQRRRGTLWEERYRSVLVEGGESVRIVGAYIDLNPVRAGLVRDPKDSRWSGYGEAMAGQAEARAGLRLIAQFPNSEGFAALVTETTPMDEVLAKYREYLYGQGEEVRDENGKLIKLGFTEEEIERVRKTGGRLPMAALLRLRVRYFTDGAVIGTAAFVERIFAAHRHRFSAHRQSGARRLKRLDLEHPLRAARDLVVEAVE